MRVKTIHRTLHCLSFLAMGTIFMGREWFPDTAAWVVSSVAIGTWGLIYLGSLIYRGKHQLIQGDIVVKLIGGACVYVPYPALPEGVLKLFGHRNFVWKCEVVEWRTYRVYKTTVPLIVEGTPQSRLLATVSAEVATGKAGKLSLYFALSPSEVQQHFERAVSASISEWTEQSGHTWSRLNEILANRRLFRMELLSRTSLREELPKLGLRLDVCSLAESGRPITIRVAEKSESDSAPQSA